MFTPRTNRHILPWLLLFLITASFAIGAARPGQPTSRGMRPAK